MKSIFFFCSIILYPVLDIVAFLHLFWNFSVQYKELRTTDNVGTANEKQAQLKQRGSETRAADERAGQAAITKLGSRCWFPGR